jgi:hypothetical protein
VRRFSLLPPAGEGAATPGTDPVPRGLRVSPSRVRTWKGEASADRMCECGRAGQGAPEIFRLYYPCVIAAWRTVRRVFCFRFSRSVLSLLLVPQKGRERGRKRGGHGLRDGSCEAGAAQSLWRRVAAARLRTSTRPRRPPRVESERKSPGSQTSPTGVGDNSLKNLDFGKENGFGLASVQLGFPSAWAWNFFSPVWNSFSPAWNSFRADWEEQRRPALRSRRERGDSLPGRRAGPGVVRLGSRLAIRIRPQALEKSRFAEEKSLDFASLGFDFPS